MKYRKTNPSIVGAFESMERLKGQKTRNKKSDRNGAVPKMCVCFFDAKSKLFPLTWRMGPPPGKWLGKVRGLNLPPFTATLSLLQGGIKDLLNGMILQVTVLPHPKKKGLKKKGLKKRDEPVG